MRLIFVTGMSGAGKTIALKTLEDFGYFCIDNLPVKLIPEFIRLEFSSGLYDKTAISIDIRSREDLSELKQVINNIDTDSLKTQILFLDADDKTLLKRYKESRRSHPLALEKDTLSGILMEREKLLWLREKADYVIDTSFLLTRDLRQQIYNIFSDDKEFKNLYITIMSFGYKYGIPEDADLVFDVRFLPNPFYVEELKQKTGTDPNVSKYVMQGNDGKDFLLKIYDLFDFLIPKYIKEGKNRLVIAFGCTGGRHRSVTVAEKIYEHLSSCKDFGIRIDHRDINR